MLLGLMICIFLCEPVRPEKMTEPVQVQKCCGSEDILLDVNCVSSNATGHDPWRPHGFDYRIQVGAPRCSRTQLWDIYEGTHDFLVLLPNGRMRHYTRSHAPVMRHDVRYERRQETDGDPDGLLRHIDAFPTDDRDDSDWFFYDYIPGTYCMDKRLVDRETKEKKYAAICAPAPVSAWNGTEFLVQRVIDPICHGLVIVCYLFVAVLYFVLPQLRDLVGNMLTTLAMCLIVNQAADIVSIFTQFAHHVSFLIVDVVYHVSLTASFLWLNSLGYYIWKTFRSRNVFLRVTDGRKYCYYSFYAWGTTVCISVIALFANFLLDTTIPKGPPVPLMQRTVGWLGIAVFFTAIAFTILVNIFFYLTTGQAINRIPTYGRIHHKMKFSFDMFMKLFLVMSVAWLFLLLSLLRYEALVYCNIVVNTLQGVFFAYIAVFGQKRVLSLIRQSCCSVPEPQDTAEWGEEMSPMSSSHY
ncbi:probable G-protein coupled receptor Mth-like 5 [Anabrus simplex]|uniref:probable G-protein coupled receptor Mth-like 5 n=1 Tax=Anabrus simplex TaxID=316456 RepID=UPI0035A37781